MKHPKEIRYNLQITMAILMHCILYSSRTFINEALNKNDFLKNLQKDQINEIIDCMYMKEFDKGQFICREGAVGTQLYVLSGEDNIIARWF